MLKDMDKLNKKANFKKLEKLEEEIKEKYGLYSVIVVDKQLQRHSGQGNPPMKLFSIVKAVFNDHILDHMTHVKEKGYHVFYCEPYHHIDIKKINVEIAKKYDVDVIPLKRSLHDFGSYPYKIIIRNPGNMWKRDPSIGFSLQ
jgi:hypothetical protein